MKDYKGGISFCFDSENGLSITLEDTNANVDIVKIQVKASDVVALFTNRMNVDCNFSVMNLEKIGKYHKNKIFEFPMPTKELPYEKVKTVAYEIALRTAPKGYNPDNYFSSQNSFFEKDGKPWARCTIRKWSSKKPKSKK